MSPNELIQQIRSGHTGRNQAMATMYRDAKLRDNAFKYVRSKGGTRDEAETIFSDVIINFVKNCYRPDFQLTGSLENYLFGVTRNLWFRTLRNRKGTDDLEHAPEIRSDDTPELLLLTKQRRDVLKKLLDKIDDKCRQVLMMWAHNTKMKTIAEKMNYRSPEVVRKKKHFCLKKLIEVVKAHPAYKDALK